MNSLKTSSRLLALFALPLLVLLVAYGVDRSETFVKTTAGVTAIILLVAAFVMWVPEAWHLGLEAGTLAVGVFVTVVLVILITGFDWYNPFTLPPVFLASLRVATTLVYAIFLLVRLPGWVASGWELGKGYLLLYLE